MAAFWLTDRRIVYLFISRSRYRIYASFVVLLFSSVRMSSECLCSHSRHNSYSNVTWLCSSLFNPTNRRQSKRNTDSRVQTQDIFSLFFPETSRELKFKNSVARKSCNGSSVLVVSGRQNRIALCLSLSF